MTKILGGTFGGIYKIMIKIIDCYQHVDCCVLLSPPPPESNAMLLISIAFLLLEFYGYAIQYAILFWFPSDGIGEYWTLYLFFVNLRITT